MQRIPKMRSRSTELTTKTVLSAARSTAALAADGAVLCPQPALTLGRPALASLFSKTRALLRSLQGGPGYAGPPSDHFDGRHFFNPEAPSGRFLLDVARCAGLTPRRPWPRWVENCARPALPSSLPQGQVALTFVNHITFLIQFQGLNILTDPVYSERVSPLRGIGPKRVRAPGLPFDQLPPIDLVLISHNHYDHLDLDTLARLEAAHRPCFVAGLGNRAFLREFGLKTVHELDWWQTLELPRVTLTMTPAQHWSGRGARNRNRSLWGGFHVRSGGMSAFFAGDTGYWSHFRDIRRRLGTVDLALLPIGAYAPRHFEGEQHMDPQEAVRAHLDLAARTSVGTHFGCFQLADEGIDDPLLELALARARHGVSPEAFLALETGETRHFLRQAAPACRERLSA